MAESGESVDDFLSKVEELESIVKGFRSNDDELMKESMTKADGLMAKLKVQEDKADDGEDLPKTKIGFSKTSINRPVENPAENDVNYEGMDQAAFMKVLEADAKDRAKRRHEREKVANGLKDKGNGAFKQGNYEQALDFYTQAIQSVKDNTILYTNRAQTYIKLGKYTEALTDCDWALRIFPNCVKALIHTGRAHLGLKDYSEAREAYNKALSCDPKVESLVKDYLAEVDRVELTDKQEHDAEAIFKEGDTSAMGLLDILKRTNKPEQLPVFYSGGFRVLKTLLTTTSDRTLFRTNGGMAMLTEHETLVKCLTASPKSLSQEQLDMLCSAFEMYTEACRDNDRNTEDFLLTKDLPQNCLKFLEVKLKGPGKILKLCIIHCVFVLSQSAIGQSLIITSFDLSKLLALLFTSIRNDPKSSSSAAGILNNLALQKKFKTMLRDKVDVTVAPAFEALLNEARATTVLPVCINMVTNLTGDKCIRTKLVARKELWEKCSGILIQHKDNLPDIQSISVLESILGLFHNLTSSPSENLRESGVSICDSCLSLLNSVDGGVVLLRCLGVTSNILPNCIPAVDLVVQKGGTDSLLKFVKSSNEEEMKYALKSLTACTQINETSRKTVVDMKGLGTLIQYLKSNDEIVVGNAALCLSHCTQVHKVCTALTKTDIIKELLILARDGKRPGVQQNCAILIAKLAQGDPKHLERLRELHGIEILHSCMKYIK